VAIGDLLRRNGLIEKRGSKRHRHSGARSPMTEASAPHEVLAIDFKGQFRLGNAQYCFPLTFIDQYSRFLLCCRGLDSTEGAPVRRTLERVLHEHGLPEMIRSDNGAPFASNGRWGLSDFGIWLMKLVVAHERTRPSSPQDNGRLERFHRTLKAETARPPALTMRRQQNRFDAFLGDYNYDRAHQGIDGGTPGQLYVTSARAMPTKIPPPEYPGHYEVRRVGTSGQISICGVRVFLNEALASERVGLQEIDDGTWSIHFYGTELGRFDEWTHDVC
jgi:putative transposase